MEYFKLGLVLSVLFSTAIVNCGSPLGGITDIHCNVTVKTGACHGKDTVEYKNVVCQCEEVK